MSNADDLDWWHAQASVHWTLTDALTQLDGEHDLNFRVGDHAILKVMRPGCNLSFVEMQVTALDHLAGHVPVPGVVPSDEGERVVAMEDAQGRQRLAWMVSALSGKPYATVRPQSRALVREVGQTLGLLDRRLETFAHPELDRDIKWNLADPLWSRAHLGHVDDPVRRDQLTTILDDFERECAGTLRELPVQAIHNDLNDYNLLALTRSDGTQDLTGVIDFGDMIRSPAICDLAIAGAYIVLDQVDPVEMLAALTEGYCAHRPLSEGEVGLLWPLLLTRLAVSALNAVHVRHEKPDDPYVMISQAPIDRFLQRLSSLSTDYANARLRKAAGHDPVAGSRRVSQWLETHAMHIAPVFREDLSAASIVDLSVTGAEAPQNPVVLDGAELTDLIGKRMAYGQPALGRYGEPRLVYTAPGFFAGEHPASDRRTVHMAIDVFLPAWTPVHAPLDGIVHSVEVCPEDLGFGGVLVLRHETDDGTPFFSLYGHLAHDVATRQTVGKTVAAGEEIARLGPESENGGWEPHVHLQLGLIDLPGPNWPGVGHPDEWDVWQSIFPDPAVLLGLPAGHATASNLDIAALREKREARTTRNLKLSYDDPVAVLRGWKSFLYDDCGRTYLDAYNNVPHVGHAHPRISAAVARQMRLVNTNTRYLQPVHEAYAEALCSRFPDPLDVCFLLSSASEANEVALRLTRASTSAKDTIVSASGYHGHTCAAIDLSDYKFSGPGGDGRKDWVHVAPIPDPYRGEWGHSDPEAGAKYAAPVATIADAVRGAGRKLAAFISEPFPSVGGQIVPPDGYLSAVYSHVRAAGGVCIADEVQTGLGRLGRYPWAFAQQDAIPDIVVLGKPIGNGYPLAAVVTTRAIADAFANGMEFFSTFGGSTVSCVAGLEVLRILDDEALPENAETVGAHLLDGLREIAQHMPAIGDVRGMGFFIGVEMIESDGAHAPRKAAYVVNRMREQRILIGSDGPKDNVLKIRPPLCFTRADADYFLDVIGAILAEDAIMEC